MQNLLEWISENANRIKNGNITLDIKIYQGSVVAIEKTVKEKNNFEPGKKKIDKYS
ncbi:hypothetical protein KAR91_69930 [Candidatus Pacearchaeota archaeon]|nr:hypothetical protein [Candidatus Pacearchaeota archaeon]